MASRTATPFIYQPGDVPGRYGTTQCVLILKASVNGARYHPRYGAGRPHRQPRPGCLCALQTIDNPHIRLLQQMTVSLASDKWRPSFDKSKAFMQGPSLSTTRGSPRSQGLQDSPVRPGPIFTRCLTNSIPTDSIDKIDVGGLTAASQESSGILGRWLEVTAMKLVDPRALRLLLPVLHDALSPSLLTTTWNCEMSGGWRPL